MIAGKPMINGGIRQNAANIIVTGYGVTEEVKEIQSICVSSVVDNTEFPYVLTYYDNVIFEEPLTVSWNFYCEKSPAEFICLLNNDTEVSPGWLTRMIEVFEKEESCGFVGPSTNQCHSPQKEVGTLAEAEALGPTWVEMQDPISGFCLVFRKTLWEELGGFDTRYGFYGQESDFIDRAYKLGYKSFWRKDAFVFHHGEASVKASKMDVGSERKAAKKIYWGDRGGII